MSGSGKPSARRAIARTRSVTPEHQNDQSAPTHAPMPPGDYVAGAEGTQVVHPTAPEHPRPAPATPPKVSQTKRSLQSNQPGHDRDKRRR